MTDNKRGLNTSNVTLGTGPELSSSSLDALRHAARVLDDGGLIAYPTETFYGLAARFDRRAALSRLSELKERPPDAPFSLLIGDPARVAELALLSPSEQSNLGRLAEAFWPGPLTIVLPANESLDPSLVGPSGGVAVRVSSHPFAQALVQAVGVPITATSANFRGASAPDHHLQIERAGLGELLDFVVKGGQTPGARPSTIVELRGDGVRLLRVGAVSHKQLAARLPPETTGRKGDT